MQEGLSTGVFMALFLLPSLNFFVFHSRFSCSSPLSRLYIAFGQCDDNTVVTLTRNKSL